MAFSAQKERGIDPLGGAIREKYFLAQIDGNTA
jgi:hypothetical protein